LGQNISSVLMRYSIDSCMRRNDSQRLFTSLSLIILTILTIAFSLIGCDGKDNKALKNHGEVETDNKDYATAIQKPDPGIPLISPDTLELLLPASIPGAEKYPSNKGTQHFGDVSWTSCSAEYAIENGMLVIQINDYGTSGNMPEDEYRLFTFLPKSDGMVSERVWYKDGKGYNLWNSEKGEGKLQVLFEDRFVVNIDAYKLGQNDPGLVYYLKKVNVDKFKDLR
jgi:hypothetical protein